MEGDQSRLPGAPSKHKTDQKKKLTEKQKSANDNEGAANRNLGKERREKAELCRQLQFPSFPPLAPHPSRLVADLCFLCRWHFWAPSSCSRRNAN